MKKKILYIITRSELGGAQIHVLELLKGFQDLFELHLAVGGEDDPTGEQFFCAEAAKLGANIHILSSLKQQISPLNDLKAIIQAVSLLTHIKPDLVHAHSSKAGLVARVAAKFTNIPSIFTAHGWAFTDGVSQQRKLIALPLEKLAAKLCRYIIAVSDNDRKLALKYNICSSERIITVYNGLPDSLDTVFIDKVPPVIITMVARFSSQKDHNLLLKTFATLSNTCILWLIGDGPLREENELLVQKLGIEQKVKFWGDVYPGDISKLLERTHIFVLTSKYEGLPLVIIEAMRAGLPVVASSVGGVSELVVENETGFLVPEGNSIILYDRLEQLINDPILRIRLGQAGRMRYVNLFNVKQMLDKTLEVYNKVL